ncbi:cation diffusion facilitator family transporter [Paenibacillus chartarius]|uniref:Cation diffusion facilitator family transporter n=1 Tax=Paenibacillus chartarius TaxID=747481 RepID=A0ABV6DKG4_9BACL
MSKDHLERNGMRAAWISLVSNVVLTLMKLIGGFFLRSSVLIADGIHNAGDVVATVATFGSMRISRNPADEDHPYGHGKAEVLGAAFVAVVLAAAAIYMAYHALEALFEPPPPAHYLALGAAIVSLVWKQWLYTYTMKLGRELSSKGLIATAYDHLADVYASIAAVIGIGVGLVGGWTGYPILGYADPIAGFAVSLLVLKLAYEMGKESIDVLMEKAVPAEQLKAYAELVRQVPSVKRIDRLRARELGTHVFVDIRASVPEHMTIREGHNVVKHIQQTIRSSRPEVDEVLIHLNPWSHDSNETAGTAKEP